jgi:hypothetical protein
MPDEGQSPKINPLKVKLPEINIPKLDLPDFSSMIPQPPLLDPAIFAENNPVVRHVEGNYASEFHRRLVEWINDFDQDLDAAHEVGVRLVSFGQAVTFHLEDIGYWNPSLISFTGKMDDGAPVELIQHVSQISVLLVKLPRQNPDEPKRRIGFQQDE